jgi:hypothetical protein
MINGQGQHPHEFTIPFHDNSAARLTAIRAAN